MCCSLFVNVLSSSSSHSSPSFLPGSLYQELAVAVVCSWQCCWKRLLQGQVALCQVSQAGTETAWYLHHVLPYPYAFRLLAGWLGCVSPPGSHYLDKCGVLHTEIKCGVLSILTSFFYRKRGFHFYMSLSMQWHLSEPSHIALQTPSTFFSLLFRCTAILSCSSFTPSISGCRSSSCKQNLDRRGLHHL